MNEDICYKYKNWVYEGWKNYVRWRKCFLFFFYIHTYMYSVSAYRVKCKNILLYFYFSSLYFIENHWIIRRKFCFSVFNVRFGVITGNIFHANACKYIYSTHISYISTFATKKKQHFILHNSWYLHNESDVHISVLLYMLYNCKLLKSWHLRITSWFNYMANASSFNQLLCFTISKSSRSLSLLVL